MPHRIGYCCINNTLAKSKFKITTGRTMRKATYDKLGSSEAIRLAQLNADDLLKIMAFNIANKVQVFRIGGGIFPWHHKWFDTEFRNSDARNTIVNTIHAAGKMAKSHNIRISSHPDHFVKLASEKPTVVEQAILDLEIDSTLFDMMGHTPGYTTPINIHIGQGGDKPAVAKRFIHNFKRLSPSLQQRLVIENDDKLAGWSVAELYDLIYSEIGTPITFDYFHHTFHPDNLSEQQAFELAYSTWPDDVVPLFHYSESKKVNESVDCNPRAHADYVFNKINDYGYDVDIDLEAKAKELAMFKYRELYD